MYNRIMSEIIPLQGGLRLAYEYIPYIHTVSVGVFVKIGSRNEISSDNGIAHFTEHLSFKGTERRSAFDIVRETDALGANMNAYTSKEVTAYYFQCLDDTVEQCADVLSDILHHSVFPEEELEKERGVILEEISMVNDIPDDLSQDLCSAAFWGEHPLGLTILGTPENVRRFSAADIRAFVDRHYVSSNIAVSICGNIERSAAIDLAEKYFLFPDRASEKRSFDLPSSLGGRVSASYKDIEQSNVTLAFPALSYLDPEVLSLSVLSGALGGGMSSKLFQEVREKLGLVYSVFDYSSVYEDAGAHCIYFGTNPKNLPKAVSAVKKCLKEFYQKGMDEEGFLRAKQQVKGSLVMGSESSLSIMRALGKTALFKNEPYSIEAKLAEVDAIKREDVNALLPRLFDTEKIGVGYVGKQTTFDLSEIYA